MARSSHHLATYCVRLILTPSFAPTAPWLGANATLRCAGFFAKKKEDFDMRDLTLDLPAIVRRTRGEISQLAQLAREEPASSWNAAVAATLAWLMDPAAATPIIDPAEFTGRFSDEQ